MPKWVSSDYYKTNMPMLLRHLAVAEDDLKFLESLPQKPKRKANGMSVAAYQAMRKRQVIAQLHQAIQARIGWHKEQIALAKSVGVVADETFEPKMRTLGGIGRGIDA